MGKNLTGPINERTNVSSRLFVVLFEIISNFLIISLLINPLKIKNNRKIPIPISIYKKFIPKIPFSQTDRNKSLKFTKTSILNFI